MSGMQTAKVELPGRLVWRLWNLAESQHVSVGELIEGLLAAPKKVTPSATTLTHERILRMVRDGFDDGAISVEVERTRGYVADVRRRYGLDPNKRKVVA